MTICLRSANPMDTNVVGNTIIDGHQAGPVVTFTGTENEYCWLSGFTLRNGSAQYGGGVLGGVSDRHTHATIQNNLIASNYADCGGAVALCDGTIQNNTIRATGPTTGAGSTSAEVSSGTM